MKKELEFHPEVISDIKDSYRWYDNKLEGLGERFLNELESAYIAIQNFPDAWATFQYGVKRYILNEFPFSILYKVSNKRILIIAVMHNSRKPKYWISRAGL